jgi:alpha,alpha-trehalase
MLLAHANASLADANHIRDSMNSYLWRQDGSDNGYYIAYNVSSRMAVLNRVYLMGFPLWAQLASEAQAEMVASAINTTDMLTTFGIRSTSSLDPTYNNDNIIVPYSNWRGPVWVIANALLAYGLMQYHFYESAELVAQRMVDTLAEDLRQTNAWHECYDAESGSGLAADGFLSWNTLAANLLKNIRAKVNPFNL